MSVPPYAVDFRDFPACPCLAEWLPAYEHEMQRRDIITGPLRIFQLIGGSPKSGGTHALGGAADLLDLPGNEDVAIARQMGADATWTRPFNWDGNGGMAHNHCVLRGCPHNSPARYQIDAVDAGFNGLGHLGRGAPDDGPRPLSGRTWREGIAWALLQEEDAMGYRDWPEGDKDALKADLVPAIVDAILAAEVRKETSTQKAVTARRAWRESFEAVES